MKIVEGIGEEAAILSFHCPFSFFCWLQ